MTGNSANMKSNENSISPWEIAKLEYETAWEENRHNNSLRRQDMAFVTTFQAVVLTIIGSNILSLDLSNILLSLIAFFVLILGLNSERRLSAYVGGHMVRATEIEKQYGMSVFAEGRKEVQGKRFLISNRIMFPTFYFVFIIVWITIWVLNIVARNHRLLG